MRLAPPVAYATPVTFARGGGEPPSDPRPAKAACGRSPIEEERDANPREATSLAMRAPLPDRGGHHGGRQEARQVPGLRGDRLAFWAGACHKGKGRVGRLSDFASINTFFSDREIDEMQAVIDAGREARTGRAGRRGGPAKPASGEAKERPAAAPPPGGPPRPAPAR